jgi:hypothetical protein
MLVSPFFPVCALSPLPLHPHGPHRKPPHRSMPQPCKGKNLALPQKETHSLAAIHTSQQSNTQESHRDDVQDHPAQSFFPCTADAPPISSRPNAIHVSPPWKESQPNSLVAIQRTGPPSTHIPSQVHDPRHLIFPFYASAPPISCDARILPILRVRLA